MTTRGLSGKTAFITGGTSGIGRETAIRFAKEGVKVVVSGRRESEGAKTAELIRAVGGEGFFVKADVSQAADVEMALKKIVEKFGRVDIAFNNAGVEGEWAPIAVQPEREFDQVVNINLKGVWLSMKYEIRQMISQGGGAIVNMSSVAGLVGFAGAAAYIASKHGVLGLTKTAALETAKNNIRVNAVCPAVVETDMSERLFGAPDIRKFVLAQHPIGRFGRAEEIADAVLWLCADGASFMTGQSLILDGGFLAGPNPPA